jgi:hypothetical protein
MAPTLRMMALPAFLLFNVLYAQDVLLTPKWKRDESRTLYFTETRTVPAAGEDTTDVVVQDRSSAKVKVYDVTPTHLFLTVDMENMVVREVRRLVEGPLPAEMDPYKRMVVRYEVDRGSGASRLMNAEDIRQFAQRAADIGIRNLRKKDAPAAAVLEQKLAPMVAQFHDEGRVTLYLDQRLGFLTRAFGSAMVRSNPLARQAVQSAKPWGRTDSVQVNSSIVLQDHDRGAEQAVVLATRKWEVQAKPEVKRKPNTPAEKRPVPAVIAATPAGPRAWEHEETITIDLRSQWPLRMVATTTLTASTGTSTSEQIAVEVR